MRRARMLSAAFQHLPVAATVTDGQGRLLFFNEEAKLLAAVRPGKGRVTTCRELWRCRVPHARCPLRRVATTGRSVHHAYVRTEGQDGPRTMVERVSLWRTKGGRARGVIITGPATAFLARLRRLRRQAHVDALTAVLNRGSFDEHASRLAPGDRRRPRAFIMADVDGLKAVNDTYGHAAGDLILRRLGRILLSHTRRSDVVGRVGGDEFAVFCPGANRSHAPALVKRLRDALKRDNAQHPGEPRLGVQFGVAWSAAVGAAALRRRADRQLYRFKRRPRRPPEVSGPVPRRPRAGGPTGQHPAARESRRLNL